jgi:hypothetical protein
MATGGKFWQGAASGALSSFTGSLTHNLPVPMQIGASTIVGGLTSKISGGTFWEGAATGFTVAAFNHAMDRIVDKVSENKFFKRLRNHYEGGSGEDFIITTDEFRYLLKKGKIDFTKSESIGDGLFKAPIDFYESGFDLKYSFGEAKIIYENAKNLIIYHDFNDIYNFDSKPWGTRTYRAEMMTRAYNWWSNGTSFNIYYNKFYLNP